MENGRREIMKNISIYGAFFTKKQIIDELCCIDFKAKKLLLDDYYYFEDEMESIFKKTELLWYQGNSKSLNDSLIFVGREWETIKDEETGKQFRSGVEKELVKLFNKEIYATTCTAYKKENYED